MPRRITPATSLDVLKREAKRWLKALRDHDPDARERLRRALHDPPAEPTLRDVQLALAREYGLAGWAALKERLADDAPMRRYDRVAEALVAAYHTGEAGAMRAVWDYFGHGRTWDATRRYVRVDLGKHEVPPSPEDDTITLDEACWLVARAQGFESWDALAAFVDSVPRGKTIATKAVGAFAVGDGGGEREIAVRTHDWDELLETVRERRMGGLHANGQMTDAILGRVAALEHLTALNLEGSKALGDDGLRHLARMPALRHLNLMGCGFTDRGLEVLRHLPALETLVLSWTRTTDAGAAHLAACPALRAVDLGATPSGDGAIRALAGKRALRRFSSGNGVTDAGLALLRDVPAFAAWQGDGARLTSPDPDAAPNHLTLRGSFTDRGMAHLVGLDGLFALDIDNAHLAVTGAGLAPLAELPHLEMLAFDAKDDSMGAIAALPHLRFLMCQDTTAGDDGFVALGRSRTIEHIWGRRCYNLRRRGFLALSEMPALRYLSVSCRNVDDAGLASLPRFPALRELMPMDVPDDGYRHVGRCAGLESLVLMYCRETTDVATSHITGLAGLRRYFASYTRITDRTPRLLSGMDSLEEITFDTCAGLTNAGIAALARLPRLRELSVGSMPHVTADVVAAFPASVRVRYAT